MSFKSEAQRRFMYKNHPEIATRWTKEEGLGSGSKLPERIHPKKKSASKGSTVGRFFKKR